jgi:type II secretory pathway pseudopilin PulG
VSTGWIIVIVVVAVLALLAAGGAVATSRRTRAGARELQAILQAADAALAHAHAEDKGWERSALEAAAREAFAARHADREVRALHLVQVIDKPGTEADQAVFRVVADDGEHEIVLGRHDDAWVPA